MAARKKNIKLNKLYYNTFNIIYTKYLIIFIEVFIINKIQYY